MRIQTVRHINDILYVILVTVRLMRLLTCIIQRTQTTIRIVQSTMTDMTAADIRARLHLRRGGIVLITPIILVLRRLLQSILAILTIEQCILIQNIQTHHHVVHHPIHPLGDTEGSTLDILPKNDITLAIAKTINNGFRIRMQTMVIHTHIGTLHIRILIIKTGQENDPRMILSSSTLQITRYKPLPKDNNHIQLLHTRQDTYHHMQPMLRITLLTDQYGIRLIMLTTPLLDTPFMAVVSPVRMPVVRQQNMVVLQQVLLFMLVDHLFFRLVEDLHPDQVRYYRHLLWVVMQHQAL